jgi:hypothetical protein
MAVRLVVMPMFAVTFSSGMSGICVGTHDGVTDLPAVHVEDKETLGSAEVLRNRHAIYGSYRYLHGTLLLKSLRE